jgi:hypothetical protein
VAVLDQVLVLALARSGPVRLRDLVLGEHPGEVAGVEAIRLLLRLRDDPELLGVSEDQTLREGLEEYPQPVVGRRGLHDGLERLLLLEELGDPGLLLAAETRGESLPRLLVDNADGQRSLVKVDSGVAHGMLRKLGLPSRK